MGRSLLVGMLLLVGCTRPNPAFDLDASGSEGVTSEADASSDVADAADATEQGESQSESGEGDLPMQCDYQPSPGLTLEFGDPTIFGGVSCPVAIDVWARVLQSGDSWIVENCADGCVNCLAEFPLSAAPLNLIGHVPSDPAGCLRIQASVPLGMDTTACRWGALSIFDGFTSTPYLIATAKGSEPTSLGLQALFGLIPEPVKVASCNCDDVGESHDCCYQAPTPPEFLAFLLNGELLLPGDSAEIDIPDQAGITHLFEVFQAQRLYPCESTERTLSWAVHAKLQ